MKIIYRILCVIFLASCTSQEVQKPSFLFGDWVRINGKKDSKTYESWKSDYTGLGITLKNKDTVFREELSIISKNDSLYLQVIGVNEHPTLFKFKQQTDTSFVCENPQNEFPKKIKYWIENKQLKATVSNPDFKIDFIFEKVN